MTRTSRTHEALGAGVLAVGAGARRTAQAAARHPSASRVEAPVERAVTTIDWQSIDALACADAALMDARRLHVRSERAGEDRSAGMFPPGRTGLSACRATLFSPRAPPMTG